MVTIELPEHIAESGVWKDWPRKTDAHLIYGARERQIQGLLRSGKLKAYECPDESVRLDGGALREYFGDPGQFAGRERDMSTVEREARRLDPTEPSVALMFKEAVSLLRTTNAQMIDLLKLIPSAVSSLVDGYRVQNAALLDRVKVLELHADESLTLRSELADAKQEREVSLDRHKATERRRDQTLTLLKDQVPTLVQKYVDGDSLSAWVRRTPRDVIQSLLDSDSLSPDDAERIRSIAGITKPPPQPQTNGMQA